ncbi:hypothetical protein [Vibrio sp. 10N.261.46.A3]|uniref:hypothetical protein n=1 Tax=Vibrio sp. 10N.261.46.A3 TaxID=3229658 RepID=UPI0035527A5E
MKLTQRQTETPTSLRALTRWSQDNRTDRGQNNPNKKNVINQQYSVPQETIALALSDYVSGNFKYKKEIAKKHSISTQTLVRHANDRELVFVKQGAQRKRGL